MVRRQRHVSALSIKKLVSICFSAPCAARTFSVPVSGGAGRRVSLCVGRPAPRPQRNLCHPSAGSRLLLDFPRGSLGREFESLFMGYLGRSRVSNAVSGRAVCPSFTAGVLLTEPLRPRGPPSWDVAAPIRCWQTQRSQLGNCGRRLPDTHQSNSGQPLLVTSDGAAGCRGLGLRQGQSVPVGDVCPRALDGVALGFHLPHCPLWSRDRIRQCALSGPGDGCFGAGSLRRSAARSPVLSPCLGGCGGHEDPAGGGAWVSSSLRTVSPRARAHPRSVIVSL